MVKSMNNGVLVSGIVGAFSIVVVLFFIGHYSNHIYKIFEPAI